MLHPRATEDPMTDDKMALIDLLQKSGDGDFLRAVAEAVLQILMEADVEGFIGPGPHERSADPLNYRNGYRGARLLGLPDSPTLRPARLLAPFVGSNQVSPAPEGFYFQASGSLVSLAAAGYHYNRDWTPCVGGTYTSWNGS